MRKYRTRITKVFVFLSLFGIGSFLLLSWLVQEAVYEVSPSLTIKSGDLPMVSAKSFLVLDMESGTEVISQASDDELPIASITKLFSAAAFRDSTSLIGSTAVTWSDVVTEGRSGKLEAGQDYPYNELVQAMLLESSNDAASTIVRTDNSVLERMNQYPKDLGYSRTSFSDGSGLSEDNLSTAYELAGLSRDLWFKQPHLFDVSRQEEIIGTYTGWVNNSPFIGMDGYKGGKHGFTYEANRTAVAVFSESVSGAERDVLYVILGSDNLRADVEQLRNYVANHVSYQ